GAPASKRSRASRRSRRRRDPRLHFDDARLWLGERSGRRLLCASGQLLGRPMNKSVPKLLLVASAFLGLAVWVSGANALPPALTTPGNITVEATSPNGAAVPYSVTADQPGARITCRPPPNSVFGIGSTTVTCTATGSTGEVSRATFTVTVADTTAPVISGVPTAVVRNVNGVRDAVVAYAPRARDAVDGIVSVSCTPASGSSFPLGATQVTCAAVDL